MTGTLASTQLVVHRVVLTVRRARRAWLIATVRARATWRRSTITLDIADDVRLGRRVQLVVSEHSYSVVRIGPGCTIGDDVRVEMAGGTLVLGTGVDLRARSTLFVTGTLDFAGANVIQRGCTFHCNDAITVGEASSMGEYTTLVDSSHRFEGAEAWFGHNLETAPITIDDNVWLGVKATVAKGVHLASHAVVGANSVVVKDVPAGWLASGVPARNLRLFTPAADGQRHSSSS